MRNLGCLVLLVMLFVTFGSAAAAVRSIWLLRHRKPLTPFRLLSAFAVVAAGLSWAVVSVDLAGAFWLFIAMLFVSIASLAIILRFKNS